MQDEIDTLRPGAAAFSKGRRQVERILQAAREVFAEGGVESFSMNRVAARADLRLSHVQYYFPRRANLVHGLLQSQFGVFNQEMDEWLEGLEKGERSPRGCLLRAVDIVYEFGRDPASTAILQNAWAMSGYDPEIAEVLDGFYVRYREVISQLIQAANPALRGSRLQLVTAVVISILDGETVLAGPGRPEHDELRNLRDEIRSAILTLAEIE